MVEPVRFSSIGFRLWKPKPNRTGIFSNYSNQFNQFFFSVRFFRLIFSRFSRFIRFSGFFAHPYQTLLFEARAIFQVDIYSKKFPATVHGAMLFHITQLDSPWMNMLLCWSTIATIEHQQRQCRFTLGTRITPSRELISSKATTIITVRNRPQRNAIAIGRLKVFQQT
jgi:hypothetical protein